MSEVTNTSGLEPLGCAVLVEYYEPERKDSRIFIPEQVKEKMDMVEQRARVIAIGPFAWNNEPARARVGDYVYISNYAGRATKGPRDGKSYRLVNDRDIFAKLTWLGAPEVNNV